MTIKKPVHKLTHTFDIDFPVLKIVPNKNKSKLKPHLVDLDYSYEPKSVFRDRSWNIVKLDIAKFTTK
jgi:hypothetical protein